VLVPDQAVHVDSVERDFFGELHPWGQRQRQQRQGERWGEGEVEDKGRAEEEEEVSEMKRKCAEACMHGNGNLVRCVKCEQVRTERKGATIMCSHTFTSLLPFTRH